ncbi:nitrite reductase small subunit NirD [Flexibacterium corallicola]|uniref:nitrite reductase small subunit NirD n=1 Tax=Flexibacterium corallicola TaxID=3037259 RepID=UPI00286F6479|nr:nitrite reductase small subunit NirD [Pseudovibrio sp. M1P-2-3]
MNAQSTHWIEVGVRDDIPLRGSRVVYLNGEKIALFKTMEGNIYALEDSCPHKGGPLSEGMVHDGCVTCPLHNWVISLENGEAQGADEGTVKRYPVRLEGDILFLGLNGRG